MTTQIANNCVSSRPAMSRRTLWAARIGIVVVAGASNFAAVMLSKASTAAGLVLSAGSLSLAMFLAYMLSKR